MEQIELLNILKITCKVINDPLESRKFDSQLTEVSNSDNCTKNRALENKTDKVGTHDNNTNMPDYFRSSTNKVADKRASEV